MNKQINILPKKFKTGRYLAIAVVVVMAWTLGENMIRKLIYFPEKNVLPQEMSLLKEAGFEPYHSTLGSEGFCGYVRRHAKPEKIIVMFHGNAGHAAHRIYMAYGLLNEPVVLYLAEYPGYGGRAGSPTETSLYQAAVADLETLQKEFGRLPVFVIGESLGTGVATKLASLGGVKAIVLVSPFTTLIDVGKAHYPFLPVGSLVKDRFDSVTHLKKTSVPLLVIHGEQDDIVPFEFGKKLYESYVGPKEFVSIKGAAHNNLPWDDTNSVLWTGISGFIKANNNK